MDIIKDIVEIKKFYVVNSKVILSVFNDGKEETYMTTIRDFSPNGVFVDAISTKDKKVQLPAGESICLSAAKLGAIWLGESTIKRYEKSPIEGYWVKYPKEIMKIQRRQFIRIDSMFDVVVKYFRGGIFYTKEYVSSFDISGSGIGLVSEKELDDKMELQIEFTFRGMHIMTPAQIIHSKWNTDAELYYTGIRFLGLSAEETDALHKEVIQEQITQRRSGTL